MNNKTRRVALAFMRADTPDSIFKKIYRKAIAIWTKGPYSHVEFLYIDDSDKRIKEFTADPSMGRVRIKNFEEDLNMYNWDFISFDITEDEWNKFINYRDSVLNDRYDWLGIFGFIAPLKDRETQWFCSEVNSNYLKILGEKIIWKLEPSRISPNLLYKLAMTGLVNRNISYDINDMLKKSLTICKNKYNLKNEEEIHH